jgi:uncharacterized Fe-S radical SAM superfamily protein PflX
VFYHNVLFGEEIETCPAFEIFLSGCNMRCRFCYAKKWVDAPEGKGAIELPRLKGSLPKEAEACRSVSFIGGEPTVNLLSVLAFLENLSGLPTLIWNTNMYMASFVPEILSGIVDLYVADLHFFGGDCARALGGAEDYFFHASLALLAAAERTRVIVRHLLLPGHLECCFFPIARWMRSNLPEVPLRMMGNYYDGKTFVSEEEMRSGNAFAKEIGLNLYTDDWSLGSLRTEKDFFSFDDSEEEIIIESDGRVFFRHLTRDFLDVAEALDPTNRDVRTRKDLFSKGEREDDATGCPGDRDTDPGSLPPDRH